MTQDGPVYVCCPRVTGSHFILRSVLVWMVNYMVTLLLDLCGQNSPFMSEAGELSDKDVS